MSTATPHYRPTVCRIDLDAIRANVAALRARAEPAKIMAVVKADGYGHGAVPVARAALDAGVAWLGVALVEEGLVLRAAGIDAPLLVLSEPPAAAAREVVEHGLTPTVYTAAGIDRLAKAVADSGRQQPLPVHLKVDTGMHRVGCHPEHADDLARMIVGRAELDLEGVCTHFAVADERQNPYSAQQIDRFHEVRGQLAASGVRPKLVHAANSAGLLTQPGARYDLVRTGIAVYGVAPAPELAGELELQPAMHLESRVAYVQELPAGERVSYGLRYELLRAARIATVPAGYADGVPRNLAAAGGEVLIRGRRVPIAGTVTMDQLMVDVGDADVVPGDEVVFIGRQGDQEITADEWAVRLGTIAYEIVCGIGSRVPRTYAGNGHEEEA